MRPEYERLHEVDAVQCIWQQPAPHSRDFDDSNLMNHQVGPSMQAMYRQRLFTDATIVVEGIALHAHRAVLAAASPVFERMFSSHMQEGECCCCNSPLLCCSDVNWSSACLCMTKKKVKFAPLGVMGICVPRSSLGSHALHARGSKLTATDRQQIVQ